MERLGREWVCFSCESHVSICGQREDCRGFKTRLHIHWKVGSCPLSLNLDGLTTALKNRVGHKWCCVTCKARWYKIGPFFFVHCTTCSGTLNCQARSGHSASIILQRPLMSVLADKSCWAQPSSHPCHVDMETKLLWTRQTNPASSWMPMNYLHWYHMKQKNQPDEPWPNYRPMKWWQIIIKWWLL